jgi:arylformamidase
MKIYDLTIALSGKTIVYPGCDAFECKCLSSVEKGDACSTHSFGMMNHAGTHIDFPAHMLDGGKTSSDYELSYLMGSGLIIEISENEKIITDEFLKNADIQENDIVLFKTSNSKLWAKAEFSAEFVCLDISAAKYLVDKKVKIAGIDYLSVDAVDNSKFPVHKELLANNVLIIENVNLVDVPAGRYKIYVAPLNIPDMDGLPARVFAQGE